jgi:hypothetical protein
MNYVVSNAVTANIIVYYPNAGQSNVTIADQLEALADTNEARAAREVTIRDWLTRA